jgi:recombination associated protein RdgC
MWFKNLALARLPRSWAMTPGELEDQLGKKPLRPCTGLNLQTQGWVAPGDDGALVHAYGKQLLFALGIEQKLLPAAVVNQAARDEAAKLEEKQGFKPGRKQMRDIKEEVTATLLPRAFVRRRAVSAWIDPAHHWFVVDSATPSRADLLSETLRATLGELPITQLQTAESPASAMSGWLSSGDAPGNFAIDQDCELSGATAERPVVRYVRHAPDRAQARTHLADGKSVTRLGLTWKGRLSLVLTEQLQVKRLRFLDMDKNKADGSTLPAADEFAADFALMTGELSAMLAELTKALGGVK